MPTGRPGSGGRGAILVAPPTVTPSYTTTFALTENPISESGAWRHNCPFFSTVQTTGGRAYGNQPQFANPGLYEDSYAHLTGNWSANQRVEAVIDKRTTGGYEEYEIHLLGSDGANFVHTYECFIHQSGLYAALAIWKGTTLTGPADITYFDVFDLGPSVDNVQAPQDDDTFFAQIVGNTITCGIIHLGVTTVYYTQDVTAGGRTRIASGSPGMGFDGGGSGAETPTLNYGFKSFYAVSL